MPRHGLSVRGTIPAILVAVMTGGQLRADEVAALRLVPFPKEVRVAPGTFELNSPLVLNVPRDQGQCIHEVIAAEFQRAGLPRPKLTELDGSGNRLWLSPEGHPGPIGPSPSNNPRPEEYRLTVLPDEVAADATDRAGLFHAVSTFCQLVRANRQGTGLTCVTIRDWPSIRWRAFQDDLTRGPSSTLEELKREVRLGAGLKMNVFTWYMEYQYAFKTHPLLGPPDGSLKPDELKELVAYAKPLNVELLGNQQSFGHFGQILKHDAYKHLRETPDVLSPVNEESYRLLDDLYSDMIPLLPFEFFNVCCDETWGLGTGPSKPLADQIGVGGVYVRHMRRVHDLITGKYKKRMMMWGDIILTHPKDLESIPKDTIMLTWGYDPRASFEDQIVPFAKSGYAFFVCPGVNNWSRILPDFHAAQVNIQNFVRDGAKHGAAGVLNTVWDDDGETLNAPNWHGLAWGAECSWNASTTSPADFNRRIGAVLFGEKGDHFGRAVELLAGTHAMPGMHGMMDSRFWQLDLGPTAQTGPGPRAHAERLLKTVRQAMEHLQACRLEATANRELLDAFIHGALRIELIGERIVKHHEATLAYETARDTAGVDAKKNLDQAEKCLRELRDRHAKLAGEFTKLWQRENRPYALDWTLDRYRGVTKAYDAALAGLATARAELDAGRPLPPPEKIGLNPLESGARRTRPHHILKQPAEPKAEWADADATHRFGVEIKSGDADRFDMPVEIELNLPNELISRELKSQEPCSADSICPKVFATINSGKTRELPAQIEPTKQPGKYRLALIFNGPVPRESTIKAMVYLGHKSGPVRPPLAVTATRDNENTYRVENDQVRLFLGSEGAHVYRWEVRALGNRDLTMPGETDWFGFSDTGGTTRRAKNTIQFDRCGPAITQCACTGEDGARKTLTFYANTSWMEVMLDAPVSYYWDFDDPKNFAADGPTPGRYLFSTGASGAVGKETDGLKAQVRAETASWAIKYTQMPDGRTLALGMISPETPTTFVVGPGGGFGGVGIEGGPPVSHLVTVCGLLPDPPAAFMEQLHRTLRFGAEPEVTLYALQPRGTE